MQAMDWIGDRIGPVRAADNPVGGAAFECWLRDSLAASHDAALREEVPAEWLRLLESAPNAEPAHPPAPGGTGS